MANDQKRKGSLPMSTQLLGGRVAFDKDIFVAVENLISEPGALEGFGKS